MQRNYLFSTVCFFLLTAVQLFSQDNAFWQFNLQTKIANNTVGYYNPDADTDKQRTFEIGVDRMFNNRVGLGLSFEHIRLQDETGYISGSYKDPVQGVDFSFNLNGDRINAFKTLKLTPIFRFPFGRHALSLRPSIGATFLNSSQEVTYASTNNGASKTEIEQHDYISQTLLGVGGNVEYALRLTQKWSVVASVGYSKINSDKKRYIFDSTADLSGYPTSAFTLINEIRTTEMHQTGDFEFLQLGIGFRYQY